MKDLIKIYVKPEDVHIFYSYYKNPAIISNSEYVSKIKKISFSETKILNYAEVYLNLERYLFFKTTYNLL